MLRYRYSFLSIFFVCFLLVEPTVSRETNQSVLKGWGQAVDPSGDCKFIVGQNKLTIAIPGTDHALAIERGQMNAPRVLREVKGNFVAQVKVLGAFPTNAKSLVPNRRPFHGAGLLLWQDEKNYIRLERAELVSEGNNLSFVSFEQRKDGRWARVGNAAEMPLADPYQAVFLKLERHGNQILGAASYDGKHWASMPPINPTLPAKLQVGVLAGHNTSSPFQPVFTGFRIR